uniref:Uncharacterized protein n=1 Tax=Arion vulgaris TaxID=1028688 RepID=A0A0B7AIX1_9EUPU
MPDYRPEYVRYATAALQVDLVIAKGRQTRHKYLLRLDVLHHRTNVTMNIHSHEKKTSLTIIVVFGYIFYT